MDRKIDMGTIGAFAGMHTKLFLNSCKLKQEINEILNQVVSVALDNQNCQLIVKYGI